MDWIKHFSFTYLFKLVCLTSALNYFSVGYNGVVSPEGGYYNSFLDQHLNYIQWIRYILMHASHLLANLLGTNAQISGSQMMEIRGGTTVEIWLPCLGIGIMSFWTAFILCNTGNWKKKAYWWAGGILSIFIINCFRIALFLVALDRNWAENSLLDHHDLFNIAAYTLIGLLMYSYTEEENSIKTFNRNIQPAN